MSTAIKTSNPKGDGHKFVAKSDIEKDIKEINQAKMNKIQKDSSSSPNTATKVTRNAVTGEETTVLSNEQQNQVLTELLGAVNNLNKSLESQKAEKQQTDEKLKELTNTVTQLQEVNQENENLTTANDDLVNTLGEVQKSQKQMEEALGNITGNLNNSSHDGFKAPNVQTKTAYGSADSAGKGHDALQRAFEVATNTQERRGKNASEGYEWHDHEFLNSMVQDPEQRKEIRYSLERMMKNNGFLDGKSTDKEVSDFFGSLKSSNAVTTASDILGGFLTVLSSFQRMSHKPNRPFHQFATQVPSLGQNGSTTSEIYRVGYLGYPNGSDNWALSGSGTYAPIDANSQAIKTGVVTFELEEKGMGKVGVAENIPMSVSSFVKYTSLIQLENAIERNIYENYLEWEDQFIRELWEPTSIVLYNSADSIVDLPVSVVSGGQMTTNFLIELNGRLCDDQVYPLADGNYGYVMTNSTFTQLKRDLADKKRIIDRPNFEGLYNLFSPNPYPMQDPASNSGYKGLIEGFHIWTTNNFGVGSAGQPGVQSETIGGSPVTTRTGYAFGGESIGLGTDLPFTLATDEVTDFNRRVRIIWLAYKGRVALDVDAVGYSDTSAVPQQTRVYDVRITDSVI